MPATAKILTVDPIMVLCIPLLSIGRWALTPRSIEPAQVARQGVSPRTSCGLLHHVRPACDGGHRAAVRTVADRLDRTSRRATSTRASASARAQASDALACSAIRWSAATTASSWAVRVSLTRDRRPETARPARTALGIAHRDADRADLLLALAEVRRVASGADVVEVRPGRRAGSKLTVSADRRARQ
jgi:hypothetical protein